MEYLDIVLQGTDALGVEQTYKLRDFAGQNVLLYFYPKDNTSGCTLQAQELRDFAPQFKDKAIIIGVSPDSIKSHCKFKSDHNLNFILLSDPEQALSNIFQVWVEKSMYGKKYMGIQRSSFILDKTGKIVQEYRNVKVDGHANKILEFLNQIQNAKCKIQN